MDDILDYVNECFQRYGTTLAFTTIRVPGSDAPMIVWTIDVSNVEYVLKSNFTNYPKGPVFHTVVHDLLGDGIFNSDGDTWKVQRRVASHMFTMRELKSHMGRVFVTHGLSLIEQLKNVREGEHVDLFQLFLTFTFDSICDIAFSLHNVDPAERHAFCVAFDRCSFNTEKRWFTPYWRLSRAVSKYIPLLSPAESMIREDLKTINAFCYKIIAQRRKEKEEEGKGLGREEEKGDIISLFLARSEEEEEPFSDRYLRDVILSFVIAGRDTTGQLLSWMIYSLDQNEGVRAKLEEEVDELMRKEGIEGREDIPFSFWQTAARELVYHQAVVWETLRLFPSVPRDPKQAIKDDTLPSGHFLPAGSIILYAPWHQNRREDLWEKALCFMPERFIEEGEGGQRKLRKVSSFLLPSFQAGPRECLGKHVALLEATTMLAMISSHCRLRLKPGSKVHYLPSLTLPMRDPLLMTVEKRE